MHINNINLSNVVMKVRIVQNLSRYSKFRVSSNPFISCSLHKWKYDAFSKLCLTLAGGPHPTKLSGAYYKLILS